MGQKLTMADIAARSGVGKSTVSRYFNGGYVSADKRNKIQKVIEACGYEPNAFARLNAHESRVIGVVLPTLNSKVSGRVITSIDRALRDAGYTTIIKNSDHDENLELLNLRRLIGLKVDGIILSAITMTEAHREIIQQAGIPVVVLAQNCPYGISIADDDYGAGVALGSLVGAHGVRRAAYIGVSESDQAVGVARKKGVLNGLAGCGVQEVTFAESDYSFEGGYAAAKRLFQGFVPNEEARYPDTVICATDRIAYGVYRLLGELGLRIPEDVAVAGFGGYQESTLLHPPLTTLKFDSYALGRLGAETLLRLLAGKTVPKSQIVGFELVAGGSIRREMER